MRPLVSEKNTDDLHPALNTRLVILIHSEQRHVCTRERHQETPTEPLVEALVETPTEPLMEPLMETPMEPKNGTPL